MDQQPSPECLANVSADDMADLAGLIAQLSQTAPRLAESYMHEILRSANTTVLVCRGPSVRIIAVVVVVVIALPSGRKARIDDLVVDDKWRGRGIGKTLVKAAVEVARESGVRYVDLTSAPTRTAARGLYEALGFIGRDTDVFRLEFASAGKGDDSFAGSNVVRTIMDYACDSPD
jgi:ribosomal protein S18 acetylase RimI-like enzyme